MRFGAAAILLALAGCAADTIRLEHANSVSTQAKATVGAAKLYVSEVQVRRREAGIALVASDPSCLWGPSITIDRKWDGKRGLCDLSRVPQARQVSLNLQPVSPEALKALTTSISGIAAYQGALADILEEKPEEAKDNIATAIETLGTAAGDINRIAGSKVVDLGSLTNGRADAVVKLIGTLVAMQQTALKVREVRGVVAANDSAALITELRTSADKINTLQDGNSAVNLLMGLTTAYGRDRHTLAFNDRVARVRDIALATDNVTSGNRARIAALKSALDELAKTDTALRNALAGKFTAEERRRIARENRQAVFAILSQVAAIFPPL